MQAMPGQNKATLLPRNVAGLGEGSQSLQRRTMHILAVQALLLHPRLL